MIGNSEKLCMTGEYSEFFRPATDKDQDLLEGEDISKRWKEGKFIVTGHCGEEDSSDEIKYHILLYESLSGGIHEDLAWDIQATFRQVLHSRLLLAAMSALGHKECVSHAGKKLLVKRPPPDHKIWKMSEGIPKE